MDAPIVQRIEEVTGLLAAVMLAAAVAFAAGMLSAPAVVAGAGGAAALFVALLGLRSIAPEERAFPLRQFVPPELAFEQVDELVLTDADRFEPEPAPDELVLDDVLSELSEDSRVVRLFDPSAMPTPGQLKARIDRHLDQSRPAGPDASAALHEALAELRLSLK
jgi:hypothetical protein